MNQWRDFFRYNRTEQRGIFALLIVIVLLSLWRWLSPHYYQWRFARKDHRAFREGVAELKAHLSRQEVRSSSASDSLFIFDPNTLPREQWERLGFSTKQAKVILNYRQAGGRFRTSEDLKKVYSISSEKYEQLKPYIRIRDRTSGGASSKRRVSGKSREEEGHPLVPFDPDTLTSEGWQALGFSKAQARAILRYRRSLGGFSSKEAIKKAYVIGEENYQRLEPYLRINTMKETVLSIDLNRVDTATLRQLNGIGPVLSARILKYRDLLGGYAAPEQLKEVYGLRPGLVDTLLDKHQVVVDRSMIRRLAVNRAGEEELAAHPYISYEEARKLIRIRKKYGDIEAIKDLSRLDLFAAGKYSKIAPYLKATPREHR